MTILIIAVVAVVLIAAVIILRRKPSESGGASERVAGEVAAPPAEPKPSRREEAPAPISRPAPAAEVESGVEEEAAEAAEAVPPAKAEPTEAELRERVKSRLSESERMLAELREAASEGGGEAVAPEMVEIMAEGLQEVRALADRKDWGQAKDKGEALHAQLALLLRTARREPAS